MTNGLFEFLNQHVQVSAADFSELMERVEPMSFEKKTFLTRIGDVEQRMYFIINGLARIYFYRGKDEVITLIGKEGLIVSSAVSFFNQTPSRYNVEALEPLSVLSITRENLESLFKSDKKWEKIGRIMITHYFLLQELRLLDNIRYSTKERFVKFINENPDLVLRIPQKHLAAYLNIKPETFSRLKHLMVSNKHA